MHGERAHGPSLSQLFLLHRPGGPIPKEIASCRGAIQPRGRPRLRKGGARSLGARAARDTRAFAGVTVARRRVAVAGHAVWSRDSEQLVVVGTVAGHDVVRVGDED